MTSACPRAGTTASYALRAERQWFRQTYSDWNAKFAKCTERAAKLRNANIGESTREVKSNLVSAYTDALNQSGRMKVRNILSPQHNLDVHEHCESAHLDRSYPAACCDPLFGKIACSLSFFTRRAEEMSTFAIFMAGSGTEEAAVGCGGSFSFAMDLY